MWMKSWKCHYQIYTAPGIPFLHQIVLRFRKKRRMLVVHFSRVALILNTPCARSWRMLWLLTMTGRRWCFSNFSFWRDYEEKVVSLEGEVARWEQKYLEESALRQMAVDAASVPKDARIAALERNSVETERLISQVRSEKLRQMDELHAAHRRGAELESRLKDMESKLAERDAMIRVLQQRSSIHARAASSVALTHHHRRSVLLYWSVLNGSSIQHMFDMRSPKQIVKSVLSFSHIYNCRTVIQAPAILFLQRKVWSSWHSVLASLNTNNSGRKLNAFWFSATPLKQLFMIISNSKIMYFSV